MATFYKAFHYSLMKNATDKLSTIIVKEINGYNMLDVELLGSFHAMTFFFSCLM